jgi:hypothetical protein
MLKHIWSVLCSRSIIDIESNNISLIDVVEQVEITRNPISKDVSQKDEKLTIPLTFTLVNFWSRVSKEESFKGFLELDFIDPTDTILTTISYAFDVKENNRRMRTRTIMAGLPVTEGGIYKFRTKVKFSETDAYSIVNELPLEVVIKTS